MRNLSEMGLSPEEIGLTPLQSLEVMAESGIESGPENEIMENAVEGRGQLLMSAIRKRTSEVWNNPVVQKVLNHAPLAGDVVMGYKLIRGKESGRPLTSREKFLYSASVAASIVGVYYLYQGEKSSALFSGSLSESFSHVDAGISFVKGAAEKLSSSHPEAARIMSGVSEFITARKDSMANFKDVFDNSITQLNIS